MRPGCLFFFFYGFVLLLFVVCFYLLLLKKKNKPPFGKLDMTLHINIGLDFILDFQKGFQEESARRL